MIKVFGQVETSLSSNGDKILQPLKARVIKEDNGDFYLDLETDLSYLDYLQEGNLVVADTPQGYQPFRVGNVQLTKTKIKTKCWHVFYDSKNYVIADSYVVDSNCNYALNHLNSACDQTTPFTTISDITTLNSYRCVRKTFFEAIQEVLNRWGGHIVRDGFEIGIRADVGNDNGVVIRYAKNLKDISCTYNWDNVCTKILPVGYDGILLDSVFLESETQYDLPYTKTVSFQQELDRENYDSDEAYQEALKDDLLDKARNYLQEHSLPQVNYSVKANIDNITDIGDVIVVEDERLGVSLNTNVIAYTYDCILKRYVEVQFGNFNTKTLGNLTSNMASTAESVARGEAETVRVTLSKELQQATDRILGMMGNSYVIYDGDKILVVDSLPAEQAEHSILINSGGIGFGNRVNGEMVFTSAWTIDNQLDMQAINVINLTADMIKGGTLILGSNLQEAGVIAIYDEDNNLIGQIDKNGFRMNALDGSYVVMNSTDGFVGYDKMNQKIFWVNQDEFHMKKAVVKNEITLCNELRFIPIKIESGGTILNEGIGLVSVNFSGGGE